MKDRVPAWKRVVIVCIMLVVVLLAALIGSRIGYQAGMQVSREQLVGDVQPQEIAEINSIISGFTYGTGAALLETAGLIVYAAIMHLRKTD